MSVLLRRDPRIMFPDLMDWFESPFVTLRPYLAQAIRIEDYIDGDHYVVRAELAGIDPANDVEIVAGDGYLTIRAERTGKAEDKHRSEFRYGSFSRAIPLPAAADEDNVKADYHAGILTITVGMKPEKKAAAKKVEITTGR